MLTRLLMIAGLVACGGIIQGQSLGEVATKESERRARAGGSRKAFTDSDLRDAARKRAREGSPSPPTNPPPSAAPTGSDSAARPPVAQDSIASADSSTSEGSKKSRGAEYKARLDATNVDLTQAEDELKTAERDWNYVRSHPWELVAWTDQVRSRFETAKKRAELLRRQRDDIEDAARREGIPPGYLR